jgi:hypothetical protein
MPSTSGDPVAGYLRYTAYDGYRPMFAGGGQPSEDVRTATSTRTGGSCTSKTCLVSAFTGCALQVGWVSKELRLRPQSAQGQNGTGGKRNTQ